ncbi:hypothetical protein HNR00_003134 [Methylorubrum rhodinum]|uniref:Uncharacterized protein n=1 Tax=Methylorubrum rhodinum TaxID=29428 RepID=A0A840ZMJ7_9HYPH|nr:hypothetical protein [Methylorubrum rhodinum]
MTGTRTLARRVSYRIADRPDGRFDVIVVLHPGKVFRRRGFATLADAEDGVEVLRAVMPACGAPLCMDQRVTEVEPRGRHFPDVRNLLERQGIPSAGRRTGTRPPDRSGRGVPTTGRASRSPVRPSTDRDA